MREFTERWKELCAQAAVEQDVEKLLKLTEEINTLLLMKENRLQNEREQASSDNDAEVA